MEKNLEEILSDILNTSEIIEEEMKQESELKNLTARQLYCLELIKASGNPTLSELAERMNIAKASMSVMIERLEKNKFIYRVSSDSDRRVAHVHLTEKGIRASGVHEQVHRHISAMLTAGMTESEKQILMVLLNKSAASLQNYRESVSIN